ncbi:MYND-type domain-containing protein [Nephila pilipes]|uniref:MYND-type domain-containing protein n=1 Tax=Nephila pilipes TaxID=299642 RepID=A0A8X6NX67_NEPPI|nr:MYND-type domain-containing protein [Nephila pilipes]
MGERFFKRISGTSLSQHIGEPVTLLGEFHQLEPNDRIFTMKTSTNLTVTVHLQEPMRAIKLSVHQLYDPNLSGEKHIFFFSHLPAFKRMWTEEGKMYWLRFLVSFKKHLESSMHHRVHDARLTNFIFINIHKHFVESSYNVVKNFITNIFVAAEHIHSLTEPRLTKNPFYSKESREAFRALLGKPEFNEDIPTSAVGFVCSLYFEFISAVCNLLKKWIQEPDLEPERIKEIDVSFFYWKPFGEWQHKNFVANCFEKYLAQYWKEELSKMLLTCDIHNIFNEHKSKNCCDYEKNMSIFDFLKEKKENPSFRIPHIKILKPSLSNCIIHENCRLKILHSEKCPEPFLCYGDKPCVLVCEFSLQKRRQNFSKFQPDPWKECNVETFVCKDPTKRSVCTYVESHYADIETFYLLEDEVCEIAKDCDHIDDWLICFHHDDADTRNAYNQQKRKEKLKKRLRSKLNKKYSFTLKDFEDPEYCWSLYEQANSAWIYDICEHNFMDVLHNKADERKSNSNNLKRLRKWLTSVAVSTDDIIHGRVVFPTGLSICDHVNVCNCNISVHVHEECVAKSKKSKPKKKNVKNEVKSSSEAATSSASSEVVAEKKIEYCTDTDGVTHSPYEENREKVIEVKIGSNEITVKPAQSLCNTNKKVSKSCQTLKKNIPDIVSKDIQHPTNYCPNQGQEIKDINHKSSESVMNGLINVSSFEEQKPIHLPHTLKIVKIKPRTTSEAKCEDLSSEVKVPLGNEKVFSDDTGVVEVFLRSEKVNIDDIRVVKVPLSIEKAHTVDDSAVERFFTLIGVKADTFAQEMGLQVAQFQEKGKLDDFHVSVIETSGHAAAAKSCAPSIVDADIANQCPEKKKKLKVCAFCGCKEFQYKMFKRCAQCKADNFQKQRYYCSKTCQIRDWTRSHRAEHAERAAKNET